MASVYILYSESADTYYTGFTTEELTLRIERHNTGYYDNKFTKTGIPWKLFLEIHCSTEKQARAIEKHIKSMKSRKYLNDLRQYPELRANILTRFADS